MPRLASPSMIRRISVDFPKPLSPITIADGAEMIRRSNHAMWSAHKVPGPLRFSPRITPSTGVAPPTTNGYNPHPCTDVVRNIRTLGIIAARPHPGPAGPRAPAAGEALPPVNSPTI
ncbi:hypothetical protein [Actinomyces oris]|uniref:hypothetical protein n=1 Tax=Actinomyces oris TaxID=544580 RepID=UPI002116E7A3|nr:hypothetical protein [Actinomyces oris]